MPTGLTFNSEKKRFDFTAKWQIFNGKLFLFMLFELYHIINKWWKDDSTIFIIAVLYNLKIQAKLLFLVCFFLFLFSIPLNILLTREQRCGKIKILLILMLAYVSIFRQFPGRFVYFHYEVFWVKITNFPRASLQRPTDSIFNKFLAIKKPIRSLLKQHEIHIFPQHTLLEDKETQVIME